MGNVQPESVCFGPENSNCQYLELNDSRQDRTNHEESSALNPFCNSMVAEGQLTSRNFEVPDMGKKISKNMVFKKCNTKEKNKDSSIEHIPPKCQRQTDVKCTKAESRPSHTVINHQKSSFQNQDPQRGSTEKEQGGSIKPPHTEMGKSIKDSADDKTRNPGELPGMDKCGKQHFPNCSLDKPTGEIQISKTFSAIPQSAQLPQNAPSCKKQQHLEPQPSQVLWLMQNSRTDNSMTPSDNVLISHRGIPLDGKAVPDNMVTDMNIKAPMSNNGPIIANEMSQPSKNIPDNPISLKPSAICQTKFSVMPPMNMTDFQFGGNFKVQMDKEAHSFNFTRQSPNKSKSIKSKQIKNVLQRIQPPNDNLSLPSFSFTDAFIPGSHVKCSQWSKDNTCPLCENLELSNLKSSVKVDMPKKAKVFKNANTSTSELEIPLQVAMVDSSCQTSEDMYITKSQVKTKCKQPSSKPPKKETDLQLPDISSTTPSILEFKGEMPKSDLSTRPKIPSPQCHDSFNTKEKPTDFIQGPSDQLTKHTVIDVGQGRKTPRPKCPTLEKPLQRTPEKLQELKKVNFVEDKSQMTSKSRPVKSKILAQWPCPVLAPATVKSSKQINAKAQYKINELTQHTGDKAPAAAPPGAKEYIMPAKTETTKPAQKMAKAGIVLSQEPTHLISESPKYQSVNVKANRQCKKPRASSKNSKHNLIIRQSSKNISDSSPQNTPSALAEDQPKDVMENIPTSKLSNHKTPQDITKCQREDVLGARLEQKEPQRWENFQVDTACSMKPQRKVNLPPNVEAWLSVSQNWLAEPVWITTLKLASSLVTGTRLWMDHWEVEDRKGNIKEHWG
ncbi:gametogenetin [Pelobates fuscus]|uniref:gametogenetin n=1 Tax=Pelobates fuscus TaxID=191477 RepID=UPI002FE4D687